MVFDKGFVRFFKQSLKTFIYIFVCLNSLIPLNIYAAAWLQPKGQGLFIGTVQQYTSCQYWDKQSNIHSGPCFHQFSINPYIEYGALTNLTIGINPYFSRLSQGGAVSPFGLSNAMIFGRYAFMQKDWTTFSTQIGYNQPFASSNFGNNQTPSSVYGITNRQHYLDLRILYGTGGPFDSKHYNTWYADVEAAYQPYFNGAADQLHFDFKFGWKTWSSRLAFEIQELNTLSLHNPSNYTQPNYNLFTLIPSAIYWFKPTMAIQLGIQQDFFGNNIGRGTAPFAAIWWKF
jgi:hypothetical protein